MAIRALSRAVCALAGFTLAGWAGSAAAAPRTKHEKPSTAQRARSLCPLFGVFDVNHDGKLSATEEGALRNEVFAHADLDGDGKVSRSELTRSIDRLLLSRVHVRFAQLDRNHDGRIVRDEVGKMADARFARFDIDKNAAITEGELATLMLKSVPARVGRFLAQLDADRDDKLSFAELGLPKDERVARAEPAKR